MKKVFLIATMIGYATAVPLPDYPYVYSPATHGPVSNPAYGQNTDAAPALPQTAGEKLQTTSGYVPSAYPRYKNSANYELNFSLSYGFDATPGNPYSCDMLGLELEGAYYFTQHQAVTLSLGFASGGDTENFWFQDAPGAPLYPWTDSYDRSSITLMAGYRYAHRVGFMEVQVGAKCGLDVQILDPEFGPGWSDYYYGDNVWDFGKSHTAAGMSYAGYVNLCFPINRRSFFYLGYQYRGSTAKPHAKYREPYNLNIETKSMRWHEVRLGASFSF